MSVIRRLMHPPWPYAKINDPALQARVRSRYDQALGTLVRLGFRHLETCLESLGPFSAVLQFPMLLLTLPNREVLVFRRPLRLGVANALLSHDDPASIALCMGMGVKLYRRSPTGPADLFHIQSHAVQPTSSIVKPPAFAIHRRGMVVASTSDPASEAEGIAKSRPFKASSPCPTCGEDLKPYR
jgi:hypothetical protein